MPWTLSEPAIEDLTRDALKLLFFELDDLYAYRDVSLLASGRHHASCACCERSVRSFLTLLRRYVRENQSLTSLNGLVKRLDLKSIHICSVCKTEISWHRTCVFTRYELPMPTLWPIHNGQSVPSHERRGRRQTTRHDGLLLLLCRRAKTWASYGRDLSARVTHCGALSTKLYLEFTSAAHRPTLRSAHLQPSAKNPSGAK